MPKAQKQAIYRLHDELYGIIRPVYGADTSNEYDNLEIQVSVLYKKVDN